ncbi:glycosyltransferase family 2 protein [Myxococcota bacterium]|nr:glycosyltransferase family 2 protein [Myxococcota bacterium]
MTAETEKRPGLSACVITYNEADRIGACLQSMAACDELLVVDSHSTDETREIASAHGARVIERDWPGYGKQKQFAITQARHNWVLCLDADERLSSDLANEIEAQRLAGFRTASGYDFPRHSRYLGRWIQYGSWMPDHQLRLFDRRRGHWSNANLHERVLLSTSPTRLKGRLLHDPYRDLDEHIATIQRYTTLGANDLHRCGRPFHLRDLVLRPIWRFLRSYLLDRGFLDGWRGLLLASFAAHYAFLKYAKLWQLMQTEPMSSEAAASRNGAPRSP